MSDPGHDFRRILVVEAGACDAVEEIVTRPTLMKAWRGRPIPGNAWFWLWFVEKFVHDPQLLFLVRQIMRTVERFFVDAAKAQIEATDEPTPVDRAAIEELQWRLMLTLFPAPSKVFDQATRPGAGKSAAAEIRRVLGPEGGPRWTKQSS